MLGADGDGGRAEDRLGSLCRLDDGELLVLVGFLEGIVFCADLPLASTKGRHKDLKQQALVD